MREDDTQVQVESVPLGKGERQDYLDLVEDIQAEKRRDVRRMPLSEVPAMLLPYQARWHADDAAVRIGEKSRRIGFSWGAYAAEGALEAARANGMDQFYMGTNYAMAAEQIGDVAFWARAYQEIGLALTASDIDVRLERQVIGNERRDILKYSIKFASGWKYEALSAAPYNWRGRQGHARIDEAAFMANLMEVVKGALAYRLWGGRISIVSTHDGEENPFNQLVRDVCAGKLPWSHHRIDFDGALADGFFRRVCLVDGQAWSQEGQDEYRAAAYADYPDPVAADEELGCIPRAGSGAYFMRILLERNMSPDIPILRWSMPGEFVTDPNRLEKSLDWTAEHLAPLLAALPPWRSVYGQDFGRTGDLSVIWVLQEASPKRWQMSFALELRNLPFDVQGCIRDYVLDNLPLFHHGAFDARGNGQSHAEAAMQRYGEQKISCVMATTAWYAEHFPRYRQAFEDGSILIAQSEDVIADHRRVILRDGRPAMDAGRDKGSDGGFRHGDSAIAGVLAWSATRVEGESPAGETVEDEHLADTYMPDSMRGRVLRALGFGRRSRAA